MGVITQSVAAATAVVGYDLLSGNQLQQVGYDRVITGLAYTGSAAAGDTAIELYVDTVLIGQFYNSDTGMANRDDLIPVEFAVPANSKIQARVVDAAGTNPVFILIQTME